VSSEGVKGRSGPPGQDPISMMTCIEYLKAATTAAYLDYQDSDAKILRQTIQYLKELSDIKVKPVPLTARPYYSASETTD